MIVNVVDDMTGCGKTSSAIKMMNECKDDGVNFIYVTPFLAEVKRVIESVDNRVFVQPEHKGVGKSETIKNMIIENKDIATTHNLLRYIDDETMELIRKSNYILVLDEVLEVLTHIQMSKDDIKMLLTNEYIHIELFDDNSGNGRACVNDKKEYSGEFDPFIKLVKTGRVVCSKDSFFVWCFPVEIFDVFKDAYIMTYLFDGSFMKSYFDMYGVKFVKRSVSPDYEMIDYRDPDRSKLVELITVVDNPKINNIGSDKTDLSLSWYSSKSPKNVLIKKLKNNLSNYFKNITKAKANDFAWTVFKEHKNLIASNGYRRDNTFIVHNSRATNEYREKTILAYMVNRFINPYLKKYIYSMDSTFDEDAYALSEMIQWVFRSAIRDGKPITLYCPSKRMRELFISWLNS